MQNILLMPIGGTELLVIAIIILLLFGGKKIPELMRGLGRGVKEFKDGKDGVESNGDRSDSSNKTV